EGLSDSRSSSDGESDRQMLQEYAEWARQDKESAAQKEREEAEYAAQQEREDAEYAERQLNYARLVEQHRVDAARREIEWEQADTALEAEEKRCRDAENEAKAAAERQAREDAVRHAREDKESAAQTLKVSRMIEQSRTNFVLRKAELEDVRTAGVARQEEYARRDAERRSRYEAEAAGAGAG
ncbi:unnamed protein product, partial [Laminaria digitata]